ncbi:MAG: hypothetical protein ACREMV_13115 [Gemmatimonadales bacterium]
MPRWSHPLDLPRPGGVPIWGNLHGGRIAWVDGSELDVTDGAHGQPVPVFFQHAEGVVLPNELARLAPRVPEPVALHSDGHLAAGLPRSLADNCQHLMWAGVTFRPDANDHA